MANYHQHVKPIQRTKGRSAVAAAAYRSATKLIDKRTGETHDYRSKERVDFESIIGWLGTRENLWNAAESAEKRKDATTAREYEVSLPHELYDYQQQALATQYGVWLHKKYGVVVDLNIHKMNSNNPHAHLLTTVRVVVDEIALSNKSHREWPCSKRKEAGLPSRRLDLISVREKWAELCNAALINAGHAEQIDHRSYAEQGIIIEPQIHVGAHALAKYQKTGASEIVEKNNEIMIRQKEAWALLSEGDQLKHRINYLQFQQSYQLSQLNNNKVKYYVNVFPSAEAESDGLVAKPSKQNNPTPLDAWGFPVSDPQIFDEAETEWLIPNDIEPNSMEHLYEANNERADDFEQN